MQAGHTIRREMPQIIVAADRGAAFGEGAVTFRERVNVADFESQHFATQLVERLGWAVEDADDAERAPDAQDAEHAEPISDAIENADRAEPSPDAPAEDPEPERDDRLTVPSPA
jgi:hypothetical protein